MRWRDFDSLPPLERAFLASPRRVHFVGIGGIGMSALAFMLRARGHFVSGSDATPSSTVTSLRAAGVRVAIGHEAANLRLFEEPAEALVFSSAIGSDNPEMNSAIDAGASCWHRSQLLAYFVKEAEVSIAVSGTHGKSTTSAMIAHILERTGRNPSAILGAVYPPFGSNARVGDPGVLVVEADESDGSFTLLDPTISVVTNVEPEHLENYDHSETELWRAFAVFAANTRRTDAGRKPDGGRIVLNADDAGLLKHLADESCSLYSTNGHNAESASPLLRASEISVVPGHMKFEVSEQESGKNRHWDQVLLGVPGEHNVGNAIAAVAAARLAGVETEPALAALASFRGVGRRFEYRGEEQGVVIYDDYAHHPTEVRKTLEAAREFLARPLRVVFQPHRYSRTRQLGAAFGPAFEAADEIVITELYSAFEEPIAGVSGRIVYDAVKKAWPEKQVHFVPDLEAAAAVIVQSAKPGDAVLTLGAGTITRLPGRLLELLGAKTTESKAGKRALIRPNEPIARHTTMKVGGLARHWAEPRDEEELGAVLQEVARRGWPLQVLGAGSNLVANDSPLEGCALKLGAGFTAMTVEGDRLIAGGAALLPKLTHFALANRLGNMEWACGIPGTVGGSLFGNAGARGYGAGRDCASDLESLVAYDRDGRRRVLRRDEIEFAYRRSSLAGLIVTEATFRLALLNEQETAERQEAVKELLKRRRATQPVNAASAGCIWKNPQADGCAGAGALIEQLGLKGHSVGGAAISEIHGNFIINTGTASGRDVRDLMADVEARVLAARNIRLEREVRLIGD